MTLISREDTWREFISKIEDIADLEDIDKILSSMPTIEERKEGEWIHKDYINFQLGTYLANCSECGYQINVHSNRGYFNFCPYCGAKMGRSE